MLVLTNYRASTMNLAPITKTFGYWANIYIYIYKYIYIYYIILYIHIILYIYICFLCDIKEAYPKVHWFWAFKYHWIFICQEIILKPCCSFDDPRKANNHTAGQCSPMEENCPSCYVHIWPQVPTSCPVLGRFGVQHNVGKFRCGPASLACPGSNASPSRGTKVCNASGCFRCPCPLCAIAGHLWWCTTSMTWTRAPYCLWGVQKEILHCPW